jgi:hypothetical protein
MTRPMLTECPKCGQMLSPPLPDSAVCPACGIYFFKYSRYRRGRSRQESATQPETSTPGWHDRINALLEPLDKLDSSAFYGRCLVLALLASWGYILFACDYRIGEIGSSFMHYILLPIHEAGHVLFMPLGTFMGILGGSLFQLMLPVGISVAFLRINRDNFGAALGMWWGSASLLDIAPYVYDAWHPNLILLGGHTGKEGPHDWIYLLSALRQLHNARALGAFVHTLGGIVMLGALAWAMTVLWRQHLLVRQESGAD